jgi:hypothetical protein
VIPVVVGWNLNRPLNPTMISSAEVPRSEPRQGFACNATTKSTNTRTFEGSQRWIERIQHTTTHSTVIPANSGLVEPNVPPVPTTFTYPTFSAAATEAGQP